MINQFCSVSGEQLNSSKSIIVFPKDAVEEYIKEIIKETNFKRGSLPLTYLGAPLYKGRTLIEYFHHLEMRIRDRIHGWERHFLSMGARLTLINSVLGSISIHTLMVLPVPITVMNQINSMLGNFLWDSATNKRRHWIAWDGLCRKKEAGGLGIRNAKDILKVLHGKLAWRYVEGSSLWARYVKSRFRLGKPGSPIRNSIQQPIIDARDGGTWIIGNAQTQVSIICDKLGVRPHSSISRDRLIDIIGCPGLLNTLRTCLPFAEQDKFRNIVLSAADDRFVWKLSPDGKFSTKTFFESMQTRFPNLLWAARLWKPFIPVKVSCFLWKSFLSAIPTDENVRRIGIQLVSCCICCHHPSIECLRHLLFESDWAVSVWRVLNDIFDKPRVHGLKAFARVWLVKDNKSFVDCIGAAMSCCALWELWKCRNALIHDNSYGCIIKTILNWPHRIATCVSCNYTPCVRNDLIMAALRLSIPSNLSRCTRISWRSWEPPDRGLAVDIAFVAKEGRYLGGAVTRSSDGRLSFAMVKELAASPSLDILIDFIDSVMISDQVHYLDISLVRSSHHCIQGMTAAEDAVPQDLVYKRRGLIDCTVASFSRCFQEQNGAAFALVCCAQIGIYSSIIHLPRQVQLALHSDRQDMPSTGSIPSSLVREDGDLHRHRYSLPGRYAQDDTFA